MGLETFTTICLGWSAVAMLTFFLLQFVTAPYGRHFQHGWGYEISNQLGWVLMEAPSFLIMLYFYSFYFLSSYAAILCIAWLLHYFNRTFIFPFRIHTRGKKMPLAILMSAIFFNTVNAGLNGYFLAHLSGYTNADFLNWYFYLGTCLFLLGMLINQLSDTTLIRLRKPGENDYKIPRGILFDRISCPNHLGEMVQWMGFALVAWNCAALTFFIWTLANLVPRAMKHHKWYKAHFDAYPKERKALIPFLF